MNIKQLATRPMFIKAATVLVVALVVGCIALVFRDQWLPQARQLIASTTNTQSSEDQHPQDDHEGHDHGSHNGHSELGRNHEGHDDATALELSPQARRNIGLTIAVIELQEFTRTETIPAIVIGRPGRSAITITAPLGGRVTRIYPVPGEAAEPGQPLFDLRLTHEELVQAQSEFLRTAEELDVVAQEIERLNSVQVQGAIAGKTIRQREYEQQKLKASANAQHQSLLLHGLTAEQIESILESRTLVQDVTVVAPQRPHKRQATPESRPFTVRNLQVKPGQYVDAGASLCQLVDYGELYLEGRAFEQDGDELVHAASKGWELTATRDGNSQQPEVIEGLNIVYVDNEVDPDSRALHFYVGLPNKIVHESKSTDGHRFLTWQYKPGQRMQLHVPVEQWPDRIVLPSDAVAKEGVEHYVFEQNGDHFDRVPVQVEYQDQFWVVLANDGSISPGKRVAMTGAHQLQMALKNKAGGGVDPHAGHNH